MSVAKSARSSKRSLKSAPPPPPPPPLHAALPFTDDEKYHPVQETGSAPQAPEPDLLPAPSGEDFGCPVQETQPAPQTLPDQPPRREDDQR
ncbi:splicing factor, arginine/serine-rich 19-like isoform X2 [Synchiropus splendidus]|uniref:splicing factor, arginine/serine-rich 19-like isoform X2 n=1 Tax=Synchiropus splendidus TaxID=270530 RepID=UPI00237D9BA0|nr:splicing factor, arginine/serine-rich 19-like isoform X2 [Synchiropus splendidus]XP_053711696.1 splicing factor, arginine/serine-rich 19-like isoform X2 [Synchiropus splendidus]